MDVDEALRTLAFFLSQSRQAKAAALIDTLFPKQRAFVLDPARRKAGICSRRAGKTTGEAVSLLLSADDDQPGDVAYIGLTIGQAKRLMLRPLQKLNKQFDLGFTFHLADLTATAPNGNVIYLCGANTEEDTEKLRGLKLKKAALDESASFRVHLRYLIEEVLEPALIDTDGVLELIGTPSANPIENYFHKATTEAAEGFSVHSWTILDNPFIPHAAKWLKDYCKRKGWDDSHPIFQREWLGKWTTDGDTLVYKWSRAKNHYDELPTQKLMHVMGVDLGFDDAFTICVLGFSEETRRCYVVHQFKKAGLLPAQMAEEIKRVRAQFSPISIVADHGGLGKAICMEFQQRYSIPLKPAEKSQKAAYIELINGDLLSGMVKIKEGSPLVNEMRVLQWDPDKPGKEDERTPNDLCDAFAYSWREAKHYLGEDKPPAPEKDSAAYWEAEAKRMEEQEMEAFEGQSKQAWWETA